jgi:hypothetical protein
LFKNVYINPWFSAAKSCSSFVKTVCIMFLPS